MLTVSNLETSITLLSSSTGFVNLTVQKSVRDDKPRIVRKHLHAPPDNIIMITLKEFPEECSLCPLVYSQEKMLWNGCISRRLTAVILDANNVTISTHRERYCSGAERSSSMYFSFHPKNRAPRRLSSGLYNCSVDDYWKFRPHVDCDLEEDCEDGRDETEHCHFSSTACKGWVAFRNHCYMFVSEKTLWAEVVRNEHPHINGPKFCALFNASIGMIKSRASFLAISNTIKIWLHKELIPAINFSYGSLSVPNMYRKSVIALDKTVIHHSLKVQGSYRGRDLCYIASFKRKRFYGVHAYPCSDLFFSRPRQMVLGTICGFTIPNGEIHDKEKISSTNTSFRFDNSDIKFSECPNGQRVHLFISCYIHNACGTLLPHLCTVSNLRNSMRTFKENTRLKTSLPVFLCNVGDVKLSHNVVCDFRHDCTDGSDETFCQHPPCSAFACSNGQCVSYSKRCDLVSDCLDDSDELICTDYVAETLNFVEIRSPAIIEYDGVYSFQSKMMSINESCPETHYRCPGEYNDCLPVYTRCNGLYDCMDHEDEDACEAFTCPGYYRCFNSTVCAHANHLCDGWPHCPQHDDEWLCTMICPAQCFCLGHVFLCSKPFPAHLFLHLRYLDARGSGVTPTGLQDNFYLVHLSLSKCHLNFLPVMAFLNLQFLDLSDNNLTKVNMTAFTRLVSLRTLSLARNPIEFILSDPRSDAQLRQLWTVDLSHNKLCVFDSKSLSNVINMQHLNLSFSSIHTIHPNGFHYTPRLTELYLAGNPIDTFSADLFKTLRIIDTLSSQTYKLCCREILPEHFEMITCDAPRDEISSCEDLLQSETYRGFLWLICCLSLLGNMFCLVVRVCVQKTAPSSSFHVFVTNLSTADLLMGVYIAVIGAADSMYRGQFLFYDETWKHSVACKVAGFLSLLSSEVSAFIIWLITLDRFIVLHFPFSSVRFQRVSAAVACLITWLVGVLLALVPLLPVTSHWEFYSQTGICIPLPVTRKDFKGKTFSFGIFIIFNFVLFMLIATGQTFIYWSVRKNALNTDSTKISRDLTIARRLISVAVTDFLCWFPIGLCGLLALADVPIPGEVNVAFAIFVLPLNSALNPFMYTFNMLMEKRRKSREALLLQWLESCSHSLR